MLTLSLNLNAAGPAIEPPPRERLKFNAGWSYLPGDPTGLGDAVDYPALKDWLLFRSNAFTRSPLPEVPAPALPAVKLASPGYDATAWRKLDLPHDWGIEGPFKMEYPGHTGKLPWWGVAWYRKDFTPPVGRAGDRYTLEVDGAMSYATVWCNGRLVGGWPYGYSSFHVDLTEHLRVGEPNTVAIRLDNPTDSSRWYPGGGIYRNVWLTRAPAVRVAQWGTKITTPEVSTEAATVKIETTLANHGASPVAVVIRSRLYRLVETSEGLLREVVAHDLRVVEEPGKTDTTIAPGRSASLTQTIPVPNPRLWSLAAPQRYIAVTKVLQGDVVLDEYETPFGIRRIEFTPDRGFLLNGERVTLQGVCMHHDLGALGAAFNLRAAERQLEILKEMGVNAIRLTHNPSAPEVLDLCDRMGLLAVAESFDCWIWGKTPNDYGRLFADWAERDLRALLRRDRNHPSLIMWSLGNEIVKIEAPENAEIARRLVAIVHEEDTSRGATAGLNNTPVGFNGHQHIYDVFGFNYRSMFYQKFREANPGIPVYGSETASTVSSRGEYFFPVTPDRNGGMSNFQMSSYDLYAPRWAWPPDREFAWLDDTPATLGEFVWTGFDYLGEPTPYTEDWSNLMNINDPEQLEALKKELLAMKEQQAPSRSSYFGIVDLAGFKKDRFYLYQARWRPDQPMAHILPHWNWPERVGQVTPVHVYTSGDEAELFVNGVSQGRKKRGPREYRLRWDDVVYAPGELRVAVYREGRPWVGTVRRTTGPAASLHLVADRATLRGDGLDLSFVTASVVDADGLVVPRASSLITFEIVEGPAEVLATDNGDATSHVPFQSSVRPAFNGLALAIVRPNAGQSGTIRLRATSPGLAPAELMLTSVVPVARP